MASRILIDDLLNKYDYSVVQTGNAKSQDKIGHEFKNVHDNQSWTTYMPSPKISNVFVTIDFGEVVTFNGYAVRGHNMGTEHTSVRVLLRYSTDDLGSQFTPSNLIDDTTFDFVESGTEENQCFSTYFDQVSFRYLRIIFFGCTNKTAISNFRIGQWLQNVKISPQFPSLHYQGYTQETMLNNDGKPMPSNVSKIPYNFKINLNNLSEDDLNASTNISNDGRPFGQYLFDEIQEKPFFVMLNDSDFHKESCVYCKIQKSTSPVFKSPTLMNWSIPVVGYYS